MGGLPPPSTRLYILTGQPPNDEIFQKIPSIEDLAALLALMLVMINPLTCQQVHNGVTWGVSTWCTGTRIVAAVLTAYTRKAPRSVSQLTPSTYYRT
jgi:hypothetical protein